MEKILWGILGAGNIAADFAKALAASSESLCYAVASRDYERGKTFAEKWCFAKVYTSYKELLADSAVQAVYIATPHMNHAELSIQALRAGKAVICEKPAAVNEKQLQNIHNVAAEVGGFFMEAMWTKFHPCFLKAMEWIASGKIGKLQAVYADFCIKGSKELSATYKTNRLFDIELAGGALLDVGIYPITAAVNAVAASQKNGQNNSAMPKKIAVNCRKADSGVDAFDSVSLNFGETIAHLSCAIDTDYGDRLRAALFAGTEGSIEMPQFWMSQKIRLCTANGTVREEFSMPFDVNGYEYEIAEVCRCVKERLAGNLLQETPMHSHSQSLSVMKIMDSIRKEIDLIYPFEESFEKSNKTITTEKIVIYTDGGCSGNPGPGGWGCVILADGMQYTASGGEKNTTNNRMELSAAIAALSAIIQSEEWKNRSVVVNIDSQYVKNGITSWIKSWKKNDWRNSSKEPVKNKDLWEVLDNLNSALKVEWKWVKGHAGIEYNELCDQLATKEIEKFN